MFELTNENLYSQASFVDDGDTMKAALIQPMQDVWPVIYSIVDRIEKDLLAQLREAKAYVNNWGIFTASMFMCHRSRVVLSEIKNNIKKTRKFLIDLQGQNRVPENRHIDAVTNSFDKIGRNIRCVIYEMVYIPAGALVRDNYEVIMDCAKRYLDPKVTELLEKYFNRKSDILSSATDDGQKYLSKVGYEIRRVSCIRLHYILLSICIF